MHKLKTCCFTGHRRISQTEIHPLTMNLNLQIRTAIQSGVHTFICGGALGFDMIAANLILCLKEMGEPIKLSLVLPCKSQEQYWNQKEQANYNYILSHADETEYITEHYHDGCMKQRNQRMVNRSDM